MFRDSIPLRDSGPRLAGAKSRTGLLDLPALGPDFAPAARKEYGKFFNAGSVENAIDGLGKAGLKAPPDEAA